MKNEKAREREPLAIVGMACRFPKADDCGEYWQNIINGVDGISEIPPSHWKVGDYFDEDPKSPDRTYAKRGGFLSPTAFDPLEYGIPPTTIEATDTSQLLGMVVAREALADAGYGDGKSFDRDRVSVILGITGALELVIPLGARLGHPIWRRALIEAGIDEARTEAIVGKIADGYVPWQEQSFPGLLGNVVAGRIANYLDLGGTNCVADAACASALSALHLASMELWSGRSDMVLTGGIDTFNDIFMYMCFSKTPALSPSGDAKPFHEHGDGTILGEGLGVLVLKRLADAERDGDRIYALIRGLGTSSDGKGTAIYAPSAEGQVKALRRAYKDADVNPETVELVEGHGTGTKVGDATEVRALSQVYREHQPFGTWCAVGSVKSQIGHTKAAAGAAGLIKAALALHGKILPPSIKAERPLKELRSESPFYLNHQAKPWMPNGSHPRRASVSAFGFGGSNFHCVLEEYQAEKTAVDWDDQVQIFACSAVDKAGLLKRLKLLAEITHWRELATLCRTSRQEFDSARACRMLILFEKGKTDSAKVMQRSLALIEKYGVEGSWSAPEGIYFGHGPRQGKLGVLFPGQGAQYAHMMRDLACRFPAMQRVLADVDRAFSQCDDDRPRQSLTDIIYPLPTYSEEDRHGAELRLRQTQNAQPAIGAVSIGALKILNHFEVVPEAAAGHSYGEITALCASRCFDTEALYLLSRLRGRLMAEGEGDRGAMVAVRAPLQEVESLLADYHLDLVLANKNAPDQMVLSGPTAEVERMVELLGSKNISHKRLPVAAAFHSTLVAQASQPFSMELGKIDFLESEIPVFSNTTAQPYPDDPEAARGLLATQLTRPVEFVSEIQNMYEHGVRSFLEVGPGARLTGLVKSILAGREFQAMAVDASSGKRSGMFDLAKVLAHLAALGYPVRLDLWEKGEQPRTVPRSARKGMAIPLSGANYKSTQTRARGERPMVLAEPGTAEASTPYDSPRKVDGTPQPMTATKPLPATPGQRQGFVSAPSSAHSASSPYLTEALRMVDRNMAILHQMQEQTAELHRKFLEGQESNQTMLLELMGQRGGWLEDGAPSDYPRQAEAAPVVDKSHPAPSPARAPQPTVSVPPPAADSPSGSEAPADTSPTIEERGRRAAEVSLEDRLMEIVAAKTGYPTDMLEPSMSLDADLGIDSIKRVEIFSALQEAMPFLPAVDPEQLGTLHTLADIAAHFGNRFERSSESLAESGLHAVLSRTLLRIIADKTGYPPDMLEPDMSLESDLGIDSIKRVEIFSALQEKWPSLPEFKPEQMARIHTLAEIVDFLEDRVGMSAAAGQSSSEPRARQLEIGPLLLQIVADKTGYPTEMLELEMGLDTDLGIDSIKRVEILAALQEGCPELPEIKPEQMSGLQTLAEIVALFDKEVSCTTEIAPNLPVGAASNPNERPARIELERRILCLKPLGEQRRAANLSRAETIWVTGDGSDGAPSVVAYLAEKGFQARVIHWRALARYKAPESLAGLIVLAPRKQNDAAFLLRALKLVQKAGPGLRKKKAAGQGLLATVTSLDGAFGLDSVSADRNPAYGGLAGMLKTASREWPELRCRALDVAPGLSPRRFAEAVVDELLLEGPLEVAIAKSGTNELTLCSAALESPTRTPLQPGDLVLVTGGARGVTAETAIALAGAYRPTLVLMGRTPAPDEREPDWLAGLKEEAQIKKALLARLPQKSTPTQLQAAYCALLAAREIRANLAKMEGLGAKVVYRSLDLRQPEAVVAAIHAIKAEFGEVKGLIHGAGVLADRRIEDKTEAQFELVYQTKAGSLRILLNALQSDPLKILALFSSSTARFGRTGQVDYAMANEVLNKTALQQAKARPDCRVVSINWGPWDGGMVTPGLKKIFAAEGVDLIPARAGAEYLVRELAQPVEGSPVEVVLLGGTSEPKAEKTEVDSGKPADLPLAFELDLSLETCPFLKSHVIGAKAVLPLAIMVEWLAHAALHENPGLRFQGFEKLRVYHGVRLTGDRALPLRFFTGRMEKRGNRFAVVTELRSDESGGRVHARAEVMLGDRPLPRETMDREPELAPYAGDASQIYAKLFHGPDFQGIVEVNGCSEEAISGDVLAAPAPSIWIRNPLRGRWLSDPLALDGAFQLTILWCLERHGKPSLPSYCGSYHQYNRFPAHGCRIVVRIREAGSYKVRADVDFIDKVGGHLIARISDYECTMDSALKTAFSHKRLPAKALS